MSCGWMSYIPKTHGVGFITDNRTVYIGLWHYNNVTIGSMASQITSLTIVYSAVFIQAQIKENIKAPRHWLLGGEFTGDRWIPRTNGQ